MGRYRLASFFTFFVNPLRKAGLLCSGALGRIGQPAVELDSLEDDASANARAADEALVLGFPKSIDVDADVCGSLLKVHVCWRVEANLLGLKRR
jgi:hypothetical protein